MFACYNAPKMHANMPNYNAPQMYLVNHSAQTFPGQSSTISTCLESDMAKQDEDAGDATNPEPMTTGASAAGDQILLLDRVKTQYNQR